MRKISECMENPIYNIIIEFCSITAPVFKYFSFTPNDLTTISLVFGLLSFKSIVYDENFKLASLLFLIAYYFDCLDGFYARKHKMETVFGDYYDHFSDVSKTLLVLYGIYLKRPHMFTRVNIIIFLVLLFLMLMHLGCQEKYNNSNMSPSLSVCKDLCPDKNNIYYTRYFGVGTFILLMFIILFNL